MFDSPIETGAALNSDQGHAVPGFEGTCGLVACENLARLAGKNITEADVVDLALDAGWCMQGSCDSGENGGTSPCDRLNILNELGIRSCLDMDTSTSHLADLVEGGKGVIASVDVARFWDSYPYHMGHAIVLTSVERTADGEPVAFWVCDSGCGEPARRVDAFFLGEALQGGLPVNVTFGAIR